MLVVGVGLGVAIAGVPSRAKDPPLRVQTETTVTIPAEPATTAPPAPAVEPPTTTTRTPPTTRRR